jgi:7-cyano-7-deazaguanine synthase in queuosine biosynthesis
MKIIVQQNPKESFHELAQMEIAVPELDRTFLLDLDFSAILERSWQPHVRALDFLVISSVAYAIDKIVPRKSASDQWARNLQVTIPLSEPNEWKKAAVALSESLSFLTGDVWTFAFTQAERQFQSRRSNRRKSAKGFPKTPVVSLLSGGLDSFIGALDLLHKFPDQRLLFVSHYDRHISGPASDQDDLRRYLDSKFTGRISHFQVRVGVIPVEDATKDKYKFETSFRSRSLIFLGLAIYAAAKVAEDVPIIIPENGPIALNLPLNPSRRGACSTRTVHPFFLSSLQNALSLVGIHNPISNPYEVKTKGEMLKECKYPAFVKEAFPKSNSCGKAGRKTHWKNRSAQACGACVPCLLRRASLHVMNLDNENFGNEVLTAIPDEYPDFHALLGLIRRNPTQHEIAKSLMANGRLPLGRLSDYSGVIRRMIDEVSQWIADGASSKARKLAGIKKSVR